MKKALFLFIIASGLCSIAFSGDEPSKRVQYIRSHYAKYEYMIPMRDGVKLFTSVYIPYDKSTSFPILLYRTPYSVGPYGVSKYKSWLGPVEEFEKEGFIFVFQDVRGKFMSEGDYVNMRPHIEHKGPNDIDESTDTWDTIEWLINNVPNNNGHVGMWGISYPGFYCTAGMIDSHPALKAVSPQAPIGDWFWDDMHHHGAFTLGMSFNFFSSFGQKHDSLTTRWPERFEHGTPDGYQFFLDLGPLANVNERYFKDSIEFWNEMTQHPNYDQFWQARNILPHLKNIKTAVMTVGGWFDMEDLYGPLHTYKFVEKKNPGIKNSLVMGPWSHGGWTRRKGIELGDLNFGFETSKWFQERYLLSFFTHYLKDKPTQIPPEALVFETGANRWREFSQWPPQDLTPQKLYLMPGGKLCLEPVQSAENSYSEYISDPHNPVPYTKTIGIGWNKHYMTEDQRFAGRRPDVLAYTSDVLKSDLTLAGPLQANLFVSTDQSSADWVVKLIDVYPDDHADKPAHQIMIRGEIFRGRFRNSYEHPEPFVPGQITPVTIALQDILHTFPRGHRIMVQIQSSWFPLFDRNPQTYVENIFTAQENDFVKAFHRIYHSPDHSSHLEFNILKRDPVTEVKYFRTLK
jgi:hypothetical protein